MTRRAPRQIETTRLLLRRPRRTDAEAIFSRYASDPEVTRYLAWPCHQSLDDTRLFLDFSDSEWRRYGCGPYVALARDAGGLLGGTGLTFEGSGIAQTGYVFARDAWGHGYATECLRAMVDLAYSLGLRGLRAQCHPDHRASAHVMEKCGFAFERRSAAAQLYPNLDPSRQDVLTYVRAL